MDIVTLGAALNGAKTQTESIVNSHFVEGANILIEDNADGTQTISASGEVSADDDVARLAINNHKADKDNPHEVTKAQVGLGNVDNTSDANKPVSTATQTALDLKANSADVYTKTAMDSALGNKADKSTTYTKTQTDTLLGSHFVEGTNITIVDNVDGTQTINATGTISVSGADVVLTGYEKASSVEAIAETNTANEAIGILEKALDGKINATIDSEDTEMLVLSNS